MKRFCQTFLIVTSLAMLLSLAKAVALGQEKDGKKFVIRWESIEGIIRYTVQIRDSSGTMVIDTNVDESFIELGLPPGNYSLRIAAINKFEKLSFWTEWREIRIGRPGVEGAGRFFSSAYPARTGFTLRGGLSYNMFLPPWSSRYKNSKFTMTHLNYNGILAFHFGNSKFLNISNFGRFMGIELDFGYGRYSGRNTPTFSSRITQISGGANICISTRMDYFINFSFRAGGGATQSGQYFTKKDLNGFPYQRGSIESLDPYAKIGASIDFTFLYALTLNTGTDYIVTFYKDKMMQQLRFYAMVGFRI